ncbi:MAG: sce7725 family protein [bacterium]
MYLPYLRGKQFELIALREFSAICQDCTKITPIIEPVKSTYNSLNLAVDTLIKNKLKFALVLNPNDGDFRSCYANILDELPQLKTNTDCYTPAFLVTKNGVANIAKIITEEDLHDVMLIFKESIDIDNTQIINLISHDNIQYIVSEDTNSRLTNRRIKATGKHIIRLDDKFNEQKKNSDYLNILEELFTDEHNYFKAEGGYYGFSDYTVLPKNFVDGGMRPYAIAIHLTYKKNDDEVWIKHFVSDTNDTPANIQGKFAEASEKAKSFFLPRTKTAAIEELIAMVDAERYPGLGVVKKISIRNHIELMNNILSQSI